MSKIAIEPVHSNENRCNCTPAAKDQIQNTVRFPCPNSFYGVIDFLHGGISVEVDAGIVQHFMVKNNECTGQSQCRLALNLSQQQNFPRRLKISGAQFDKVHSRREAGRAPGNFMRAGNLCFARQHGD